MFLWRKLRGGRYRLAELIHRGGFGFGDVWRRVDEATGRTAAAKLVPIELRSDPGFTDRLELDWARGMTKLNHPGIVRIYQAGVSPRRARLASYPEMRCGTRARRRMVDGMSQATLRTDRLELVPLAKDHLPFLVDLNTDPVVHRFLFHRGLTADETEERLRRALAAAAELDGLGQWIGSSDGEPIGLWMLQPPHGPSQPQVPGEADLGYRLPQRYWRQGYASEGARELVRHGFEDLDLTRIFAQTMAVNLPSRATMASVGLKFVRTFAEEYDVPIPGHEQGEVEYDITRERWLNEFGGGRRVHDPDPTAAPVG